MSLQAKIMYDYELDEIERQGGLGIIPIIGHLFESNPSADPRIVLHTASEHVKVHGFDSDYPVELIYPTNFEVTAPDVGDFGLDALDGLEELEEITEVTASTPSNTVVAPTASVREEIAKRRELRKRVQPNATERNVNVRSILEDIDSIDL